MNQVGSLDADILRTFDHPQPTPSQVEQILAIRSAAKQFAQAIMLFCPHGPDRAAALRQAHEAMMTANKGVICAPLNESLQSKEKERVYQQQMAAQQSAALGQGIGRIGAGAPGQGLL